MSIMPHFRHHQPTSLAAAFELLGGLEGTVRLLAGGTELVPKLRGGALTADHIVSVNRIAELDQLDWDESAGLLIGAGARLSDVAAHAAVRAHFPALGEACSLMATPQIRNMATVAGNLANGSPCADTAGPLLVYEATVRLARRDGERQLPLMDFFKGPGLVDIAPGEILTAVRVAPPPSASGSAYLRLSARSKVDVAAVEAAALVGCDPDGAITTARVAIGAVAPTPLRCLDGEQHLIGQAPTPESFAAAAERCAAIASPIDDVRATAAYRRTVLPVLIRRALEGAAATAGGAP